MIDTGRLATFLLSSFVIIVTPGPSVLFVLSRAVAWGPKAAVATAAGNETGLCLQVVGIAAGVGGVVQRSATVFTMLKLLGGVYLVFLGARAVVYHRRGRAQATARPGLSPGHPAKSAADRPAEPADRPDDPASGPADPAGSLRTVYRQGFVVGATNPKTGAFFAAVLPEFVDRSRGHVAPQLLVLGALFVVLSLICDSTWGIVAGTARAWFASSPSRVHRLGAGGGLVMIGLGVDLLLARRSSAGRRALTLAARSFTG